MTGRRPALLLDEMFSPRIAEQLHGRGHDVLALVEDAELRALSDVEVARWAVSQDRRVVTENVKDFRRLLLVETAGAVGLRVLFTSSRQFPRSRRNLGPLVEALAAWLDAPRAADRPAEDWLLAPTPSPPGG